MNPFKIIGGLLIILGLAFRAISVAYFKLRLKTLPPTPAARKRLEASKQRALAIDIVFIALGFYVLLAH